MVYHHGLTLAPDSTTNYFQPWLHSGHLIHSGVCSLHALCLLCSKLLSCEQTGGWLVLYIWVLITHKPWVQRATIPTPIIACPDDSRQTSYCAKIVIVALTRQLHQWQKVTSFILVFVPCLQLDWQVWFFFWGGGLVPIQWKMSLADFCSSRYKVQPGYFPFSLSVGLQWWIVKMQGDSASMGWSIEVHRFATFCLKINLCSFGDGTGSHILQMSFSSSLFFHALAEYLFSLKIRTARNQNGDLRELISEKSCYGSRDKSRLSFPPVLWLPEKEYTIQGGRP